MWSLKVCAMACVCAWTAAEIIELPIDEQLRSIPFSCAVTDEDQSPVKEDVLKWVPATKLTAAFLSSVAFVAGKEGWDGSPLWVIRANHSGELIPGKLAIKHRAAYIPYGGLEVPVDNFEILCAPQNSIHWTHVSNRLLPAGAIVAGHIKNGEPLYIARCRHMGSTTPGKFDPSTDTAHISFCGKEIMCWNYEVLSQVQQVEVIRPTGQI